MGSAVAAAAAVVMAVVPGTEALAGSRGCGWLPSPRDGCAGPACRERSRAVLCGVRRGPGWPHVDVLLPVLHCGARALFCCFFSLKPFFKVAKAVLKPLKPQIVDFATVFVWLSVSRRGFFGTIKSVRVPRISTSLPLCVRERLSACKSVFCVCPVGLGLLSK